MFCIGPAPTVPGIRARFSNPNLLFRRVHFTKSCQFSPEATSVVSSSITLIPFKEFLTTNPSIELIGTIFVPSPIKIIGKLLIFENSKISTSSFSLVSSQ